MGIKSGMVALAIGAMLMSAGRIGAAVTSRPVHSTTRRAATTTSTSRPTTRRSSNTAEASRAAIRDAIAALSREFDDHRADPKAHPLRSSCNYFDKESAAKILPEVLLASLAANSPDVRESCYINWQLLSALPHPLDATATQAILSAYRSAPPPIVRPGVSEQDQKELDHLFKGKQMTDEAEVKETWQARLDANAGDNGPILAYRDELYHRLPAGFDTFAAALDDLLARMNAVADAKTAVKLVALDVRGWAETTSPESPTPEQLSSLAKAARKLADSKGPQYYSAAYWRASSNAFVWRKTRTGIETGHTLKDLADFLDEQSRQLELKQDGKDGKLAKDTTKDKKDNHGH